MNKKNNNNKASKKNKSTYKIVCPECGKDKKPVTLYDGYTICAWCGMVVQKQKYSLELIDAPGFQKVLIKKNDNMPDHE